MTKNPFFQLFKQLVQHYVGVGVQREKQLTSLFHVADVNCWQEWLIYSDIFFLLMKSGCIDFVDFLDKLILCITKEYNQEILKTNHVTWLLAQIIRIELVMTTLSTDSRKVKLFFFILFNLL